MDGREELIEEGFVDTFADLLYGGGWMDRGEEVFRDCNWALVSIKLCFVACVTDSVFHHRSI